jgi:hypothetical protein
MGMAMEEGAGGFVNLEIEIMQSIQGNKKSRNYLLLNFLIVVIGFN